MALAASEAVALAPSTAWRESIDPGEQEVFRRFADEIVTFQSQDAKNGKLLRGFHAKIHAGLIGEFQVRADLPDHARCGVFATPRVFPALVRFSNGESTIYPDSNKEPRGIAIKLIGVGGRKVLADQREAMTQDFLATSHSVTSTVRDVGQFIAFVRAHHNHGRVSTFFRLWRNLYSFREAARIFLALKHTVNDSDVRSMATEEYFGTAPLQFGPYAVKFTVKPSADMAPAADRKLTDDFLKDELAERLRQGDLKFDFVVQFYVDDVKTPIEDTSVPWRPADTRPVTVAELRIPRCEIDQKLTDLVDGLSFSPWHALEDHRPLGNVMRARRFAYAASSALRHRSPEPTGLPLNSNGSWRWPA